MLSIGVLGPMSLGDGETRIPVPSPMPRALLGLLALRPGVPVAVDEIIDGLWGDAPPESARNIIQVYVSSLRRVLGRDVMSSAPTRVSSCSARIRTYSPGPVPRRPRCRRKPRCPHRAAS